MRAATSRLNTARKVLRYAALCCVLAGATRAQALPLGFGRNQGEVVYDELVSPHFYLYHDTRTPTEGRIALESLEAARPTMERWFQIKRDSPLPVVMSAVTSGASFANFITDAIELQTMGQASRDLAWHEYVHSTMYRRFDNVFGPAGSVIHLPWMPAWWIEGLAEALSQSVGSDVQAAFERDHALSGEWPSYDKLHSLYGRRNFTSEGYATSGAFVSYLLATYDADKLAAVLEDFYAYSMPWWWPWAAVPFNSFMPMDEALTRWTGKPGRALYEDYKKAATDHWKARNVGPFLGATARSGARFASTYAVQVRGGKVFHLLSEDYEIREVELSFDAKGEWVKGWKAVDTFPDEANLARHAFKGGKVIVTNRLPDNLERIYALRVLDKEHPKGRLIVEREASIVRIWGTARDIVWLEELREDTRLCRMPKSALKADAAAPKVECPLTLRAPQLTAFLGAKIKATPGEDLVQEIYLRETTETLKGDRHVIVKVDPATGKTQRMTLGDAARPVSYVALDDGAWVLAADKSTRFLRKISDNGACLEERPLADNALRVQNLTDGNLLVSMMRGTDEILRRLDPTTLPSRACSVRDDHLSPLLVAASHPEPISLKNAVAQASLWRETPGDEVKSRVQAAEVAPAINQEPPRADVVSHHPAAWRARPLFAFPWIGADSDGTQLGFISVPLMSHLQNETLRLNFLYGVNSRFPQTELMLISNRYDTSFAFNVFRTQTFNGSSGNSLLFYDERGGSVTANRFFPSTDITLEYGLRSSTLKPLIGPPNFRRTGHQNEFSLGIGYTHNVKRFTFAHSIGGSALPAFANKTWVQDKLTASTGVSFPVALGTWRTTTMNLGLAAGRTRGEVGKMKALREVYRPLKTFVPGTGGGFNEINVGLLGPGYLTSAQYGDTQGRARFSWLFPLVSDLEKLVGIFYLERLDFTMFFNYGGAWYGDEPPPAKKLIAAHGYNLDLQTDIKGVTVNAGLGTGQVIGKGWEVYFLFGFDALIN